MKDHWLTVSEVAKTIKANSGSPSRKKESKRDEHTRENASVSMIDDEDRNPTGKGTTCRYIPW